MRSDLDDNIARNLKLQSGLKFGSELLVITAAVALANGMPTYLFFDPTNTNRNITLYTPTDQTTVIAHRLFHHGSGTGQLVVKDPTGVTTLGTLDPGASAYLVWVNATVGWLAFVTQGGISARNNAYKTIIPIHMELSGLIATAIPAIAIPFAFTLTAVSFRSKNPPTTAAKAVTATPSINGVAVTGGVISLTSAALTPGNTNLAGTAITALNVGLAGQVVSFALSAVTAFVEGNGQFELSVTQSAAP